MKQYPFSIYIRQVIISFFFILFFTSGIYSQSKTGQDVDSIKTANHYISISDLSDESEKVSQQILKLRKILRPSTEVSKVDSLLNRISVEVKREQDSLMLKLPTLTRRLLKVNRVEWNNYRSHLKDYQDILKDRTEEISEITNDLSKEINRWEQTKVQLSKKGTSNDVYKGLDQVIATLNDVMKIAHSRLEIVFGIQKKLTELVLSVDETISEVKLAELQKQKDYFIFDSKPLWKSTDYGFAEKDSLQQTQVNVLDRISGKLKENKDQLEEFILLNSKTVILQIVFILLFLMMMIRVNARWKKSSNDLSDPVARQTDIILSHPVSAAIVVGVLTSSSFYDALIPAFVEIHILLIMLGTLFLLPKITTRRFAVSLGLILLTYLIHILETYLWVESKQIRILLIVEALILIAALVTGRKEMTKSPEKFKPVYRLYKSLTPFYILILLVAIIANLVGMVSLSILLITGALTSVALGMIVFLALKIVTALLVLFFRFRTSYSIQTFSTLLNITHKRIKPLLNLIGLVVWIMFTLKGFDLYNFILQWFENLMLIHWKIGEMTISLGGILSFLGIFIVTLILSRIAASVFQDQWMVNVLPRGVAPAISLLLRITIIAVGLYMALSAAGLDLSKLGFMFGALGVGIGFGLQNVVLNFISGLILAFERPINLGDTIEVDQEVGVVTKIGVRSSSIKSYSGYEAIIPNGDLISKKVINYTLSDRDRRSKIIMRTAPEADPEKIITLFTEIAANHPHTLRKPVPQTFFNGYDVDGNLNFTLFYWTTFSDTFTTDSEIALEIFKRLKEEGIQAPVPVRRIVREN